MKHVETCPRCAGKKTITADGKAMECSRCDGTGKVVFQIVSGKRKETSYLAEAKRK
jgi:DnaJ-class molecular chaperone